MTYIPVMVSRFIFIFLFIILLISVSSAERVFFSDGVIYNGTMSSSDVQARFESSSSSDSIIVFYDQLCSSCQEALSWLSEYKKKYPDIRVTYYDIYSNSTNRQLFEEYTKRYHMSSLNVPVAFVGPAGLEGSTMIKTLFEPFSLLYE
ncbi:MAG: hypothetical protein LUQ07_07920, partial [Methanospirillum sp.]|nr:hypothetical protein [Methanospirillum sp.]